MKWEDSRNAKWKDADSLFEPVDMVPIPRGEVNSWYKNVLYAFQNSDSEVVKLHLDDERIKNHKINSIVIGLRVKLDTLGLSNIKVAKRTDDDIVSVFLFKVK